MANLEGRIELALQAYRRKQFSSIRSAASAYDIPRNTLGYRLRGTPSRSNSISPRLKLTQIEEDTLVQWILSMDTRGISPTQALVKETAELLLAERIHYILAKLGQH